MYYRISGIIYSINATLKSYPAIKFSVSVQGMEEMNFRIETKEAFQIVGKSCPLSRVLEENFARIPHEWDTALENETLAKLYGIMNDKPEGLLGVSVHMVMLQSLKLLLLMNKMIAVSMHMATES